MTEKTSGTHQEIPAKQITAYCEPWSLRSGAQIRLRASSLQNCTADLAVTRLICGDPTSAGPGFEEHEVKADLPAQVSLTHQPLTPGSYGTVDLHGLTASRQLHIQLAVLATLPHEPQTILSIALGPNRSGEAGSETSGVVGSDGSAGKSDDAGSDTSGDRGIGGGNGRVMQIVLDAGRVCVRHSNAASDIGLRDIGLRDIVLRDKPLAERRWYQISCEIDLVAETLTGTVTTEPSRSPARDLNEPVSEVVTAPLALRADANTSVSLRRVLLGGETVNGQDRGAFDGRIGAPSLRVDEDQISWLLHGDMAGRSFPDAGPLNRAGILHQLPTRAITGPSWDSTEQCWTNDPGQWNAVHFHKDDLYDARWTETAQLTLPDDLPSGIYCFRLTSGDQVDRVPFFVRPAAGAPTADVAMLMSSATYIAYANHRMLFEGADFIGTRTRLRDEHAYVRAHPELGRSMYEKHPDGSGVMFSSRRRPVLNLRPGADGWNFTPDTDINAFLHHTEIGHDVIADEDIHADGFAALAPYRVIVTSSHPEYWSTTMLDALEAWQRQGGRLMYLGGNGFYWRVAFSDAWPGAMELRRAEDGVRNWSTGDGESYHAFTGEYGGMWRRNNRAPNELVGVGFAAQGFGRATYFDVNRDSQESRASWIWQEVTDEDGRLGTSGLGGGAAGQEIDRFDTRLGSPKHAVVLASATDFGADMVRTKEEFEASVDVASPDPYVRADVVFYETPGGGAVFSASSISWFGALARNGYDNDIAQMTTNVLRRFADPEPFPLPDELA